VKRSRVCPYVPGEDPAARHRRRLLTNVRGEQYLRGWCEGAGIALTISNDGHHWRFTLPNGRLVQWWPSSAKLVFGDDWDHDLHVHDYERAREIICRELSK